jgi:hypothetical protein
VIAGWRATSATKTPTFDPVAKRYPSADAGHRIIEADILPLVPVGVAANTFMPQRNVRTTVEVL